MSIKFRHMAPLGLACAIAASLFSPTVALAEDTIDPVKTVPMLRLYNPYSGEHFYTEDGVECDTLIGYGWVYEHIGWYAPVESKTPVYRLYNPYSGDHHYTMDGMECNSLERIGWIYEGIGWYSDDNRTVPLYRQFNPYVEIGSHNYTTSKEENNYLVKQGWLAEGIAWYGGNETIGYSDNIKIMGESEATEAQIVAHYKAQDIKYPEFYATKGAKTIEDFVRILFEEAEAEGVRADIVYAQAMLETDFLRYTGVVHIEQCNFAGIGATGGDERGHTFKDVREGLRAQVQHLKAYASTDPLNNTCVDPRFDLVSRGSGPTLYRLSTAWAVSSSYGDDIADYLSDIFSIIV